MKRILECSTRGDRRFSAFGAYITINGKTDCIENFYQRAKKTESGDIAGKGKPFHHFICPFCGLEFPAEEVSDLYKGLWIIYFNEHPDLLEYASGFDDFNDMFKGKSVNCQADVVRELVKDKDAFVEKVKSSHWYRTIYKLKIVSELKNLGASNEDIALLTDEMVMNAITNRRKPEDVAWAILQ